MKPTLMRLLTSLGLPLLLVLAAAGTVAAQEEKEQDPNKETPAAEKQDPKPEADKPEATQEEPEAADEPEGPPGDVRFTLGASYSLWLSSFDFAATTATNGFDLETTGLQGIDLSGRLDFDEDWGVQVDVELALGLDYEAIIVGVGGVYRPSILEDPWDTHLRGSVLFGTLDEDDLPGDFDDAVGVEVGGGVDLSLSDWADGLSLNFDLMLRFLEFDFEQDATAVTADSEVGGFGVRFLLGLAYRF